MFDETYLSDSTLFTREIITKLHICEFRLQSAGILRPSWCWLTHSITILINEEHESRPSRRRSISQYHVHVQPRAEWIRQRSCPLDCLEAAQRTPSSHQSIFRTQTNEKHPHWCTCCRMGAAPTKAIIQQTHPYIKILEIEKQPGQSINLDVWDPSVSSEGNRNLRSRWECKANEKTCGAALTRREQRCNRNFFIQTFIRLDNSNAVMTHSTNIHFKLVHSAGWERVSLFYLIPSFQRLSLYSLIWISSSHGWTNSGQLLGVFWLSLYRRHSDQ